MLKRTLFSLTIVALLWLTFLPAGAQPEAATFCVRPQVVVKLPRLCLPLV